VPAGHNFSYAAPDRESIQLTQAFDDGANTYLEFSEIPADAIDIRDLKDDRGVTYTLDAHYVVVPGIYGALRVTVAGHSTTIINEAMPADERPARLASPPAADGAAATSTSATARAAANDPQSRQEPTAPRGLGKPPRSLPATLRVTELQQEIATLEDNVQRLSAELEEAHRAGRGGGLYLRKTGGVPRVLVTFEDHRAETHIDAGLLEGLGSAARSANHVYLHGHTDALVGSERGTELARRRAVAVRRLLISLNVQPERIRLFYQGAGHFIADNSTEEGRALNRRVEIELRTW
jgi:hypothetical protein